MASITGIELGTDSCVLVRTRQTHAVTEVSALHPVYAAEWPSQDVALAALLRRVRREKRLPRRARVVAWHLPDSASISDPATRAALRPLTAAGFRIDAVVSPPQALALLAASRPPRGDAAAAWLALNRHGAAIAIVRGSELLFSRVFDWSYKGTAGGANAQLLERYSLVAHLAPELRRGIDMVRASYGAEVDSAITCGDLPDLRSLTMPLIEELDLEVETLDSTDGLVFTAAARTQRAAELAPALRLACAAATRAGSARRNVPVWMKAAAAAIIVVGGAVWAYSHWPAPRVATNAPRQASVQSQVARRSSGTKPPASSSATQPVRPKQTSRPPASLPVAPRPAPPRPQATPVPSVPPVRTTPAATAGAAGRGATGSRGAAPPARPTAVPPVRPTPERVTPPQPSAAQKRPIAAPKPPAVARERPTPPKVDEPAADTTRAQASPPRPRPLNAPLPGVSSILISSDRRLAVIDGKIVGVGEAVGPRVVARIEPSFVVLREPSGFELRVPLR